MRGKFKQAFLRVAADGQESYTPANLKIGEDKTVEVFVEYVSISLMILDFRLTRR